MQNILIGFIALIGGALLCATFLGIILGIPVALLGMYLIAKGVFQILWGSARVAARTASVAGKAVSKAE